MKSSLDGVWAKYANAMRHADHFEEIYRGWRKAILDNPPVDFPQIQHANRLNFSIKAPPPDPSIVLVMGDFVHNLRVSLDHLVGQVAMRDGYDIKTRSTLSFPIFTNKSEYNKKGLRKIEPFIKDQKVIDAIEAIQPYHGKNPQDDPLWILSELDNIDKHRTLVATAPRINKKGEPTLMSGPAKDVKPPVDINRYTIGFQIEIQPNNPIFTNDSASHSMNVWIDTTLVLTDTGLVGDNWPIQKLIETLSARVQGILNEFEKRFF